MLCIPGKLCQLSCDIRRIADLCVHLCPYGIRAYIRRIQLHIRQTECLSRFCPRGAYAAAAGRDPRVEGNPFSGIVYGQILQYMIILYTALYIHLYRNPVFLIAYRIYRKVVTGIRKARALCFFLAVIDIRAQQVRAARRWNAVPLSGQIDLQAVQEVRSRHRHLFIVSPTGTPADLRRSQTAWDRQFCGDAGKAVQILAVLHGHGLQVDHHLLTGIVLQVHRFCIHAGIVCRYQPAKGHGVCKTAVASVGLYIGLVALQPFLRQIGRPA